MGYWNEGLRLGPNPSFFAWFNNFHAIGVQHFCLNKSQLPMTLNVLISLAVVYIIPDILFAYFVAPFMWLYTGMVTLMSFGYSIAEHHRFSIEQKMSDGHQAVTFASSLEDKTPVPVVNGDGASLEHRQGQVEGNSSELYDIAKANI